MPESNIQSKMGEICTLEEKQISECSDILLSKGLQNMKMLSYILPFGRAEASSAYVFLRFSPDQILQFRSQLVEIYPSGMNRVVLTFAWRSEQHHHFFVRIKSLFILSQSLSYYPLYLVPFNGSLGSPCDFDSEFLSLIRRAQTIQD